MAGGTFVTQNKVRPGVYINMSSAPQTVGTTGERGVAALALPLSWGAEKTLLRIQSSQADLKEVLGYELSAPQLLLVQEALKRAQTLLLYRLNTGVQASATHGVLEIKARYSGTRGNQLAVVIQSSLEHEGKYEVKTLLEGVEVDRQVALQASELQANSWVSFAGTDELEPTAGIPLTGGTDGAAANSDHTAFLSALELQSFNTVALVSENEALKGVYTAFIRRLRETEGYKVQAVLANYPIADHEGVISVKNGVILADGTTLTAAQATAWVAGATAGAAPNESLTYRAYDGAVDAAARYTHTQTESALQNGEFVFTASNGQAVVEQDINTLTRFTADKARSFAKNRVIRVLDSIANDLKRIFEASYVGRVNNNNDGRSMLRNEAVNYLQTLQSIAAIQNFNPQTDFTVQQGEAVDSVLMEVSVQPVDAAEKIYLKVTVA